MRRILLQVSNSVEILTIVMPDPWQIPLPSDLHLGALVELHLYGTREGREASLETDPPPPPSLPSLKRLHLAGSHFDPTEVIFFITLSPSLTHLRLSGLEYRRGTQYILSAICRLSASYPLPTELERILVQPRQPDFPPVGYTAMMYIRDFEDLMYFAPGLPGVVFMKPLSCSLDVDGSIDDANRFWLSRIGGGLGCWDETPVV
ncbi:hypothetical protein JAAARDRAFT_654975 [Jaapia argillacea MUCL 33604]|uniref:Uncharacterized protein n=1 Tax=Jaapia argillacea MUCL 33604 TaxID=933084 RepID=A0A067PWS6_9AGAM|nr:hypothetical protein JAAARDRAFT_654975 [Jaapia argillacea MUCL 33604]